MATSILCRILRPVGPSHTVSVMIQIEAKQLPQTRLHTFRLPIQATSHFSNTTLKFGRYRRHDVYTYHNTHRRKQNTHTHTHNLPPPPPKRPKRPKTKQKNYSSRAFFIPSTCRQSQPGQRRTLPTLPLQPPWARGTAARSRAGHKTTCFPQFSASPSSSGGGGSSGGWIWVGGSEFTTLSKTMVVDC